MLSRKKYRHSSLRLMKMVCFRKAKLSWRFCYTVAQENFKNLVRMGGSATVSSLKIALNAMSKRIEVRKRRYPMKQHTFLKRYIKGVFQFELLIGNSGDTWHAAPHLVAKVLLPTIWRLNSWAACTLHLWICLTPSSKYLHGRLHILNEINGIILPVKCSKMFSSMQNTFEAWLHDFVIFRNPKKNNESCRTSFMYESETTLGCRPRVSKFCKEWEIVWKGHWCPMLRIWPNKCPSHLMFAISHNEWWTASIWKVNSVDVLMYPSILYEDGGDKQYSGSSIQTRKERINVRCKESPFVKDLLGCKSWSSPQRHRRDFWKWLLNFRIWRKIMWY